MGGPFLSPQRLSAEGARCADVCMSLHTLELGPLNCSALRSAVVRTWNEAVAMLSEFPIARVLRIAETQANAEQSSPVQSSSVLSFPATE